MILAFPAVIPDVVKMMARLARRVQFKFLPGTESLTYNGVLFLKPVHSDLNMTIALALVSFIVIQVFGVAVLGF